MKKSYLLAFLLVLLFVGGCTANSANKNSKSIDINSSTDTVWTEINMTSRLFRFPDSQIGTKHLCNSP